jgi:hypothetical protein
LKTPAFQFEEETLTEHDPEINELLGVRRLMKPRTLIEEKNIDC